MHGGIANNYSSRWKRQFKYLKRRILESKVFSSSINFPHMHLCHLMLSKPLKWTNLMVENSDINETPLFQTQIPWKNIMVNCNQWHFPMANQKVCNEFLRSVDLTSENFVPSVLQCVRLITKIAVSPVFLVNRMILKISPQCSKHLSNLEVMNAFSAEISLWIKSHWNGKYILKYPFLIWHVHSICGGANTATVKLTKKHFRTRRMRLNNISKRVPPRSYVNSLIACGISWVRTALDWWDMWQHGLSKSRSSIAKSLNGRWCQSRLFSTHLDKIWRSGLPKCPTSTPKSKVKKFGIPKTSWEKLGKTVFKLYLTVQVQIHR